MANNIALAKKFIPMLDEVCGVVDRKRNKRRPQAIIIGNPDLENIIRPEVYHHQLEHQRSPSHNGYVRFRDVYKIQGLSSFV